MVAVPPEQKRRVVVETRPEESVWKISAAKIVLSGAALDLDGGWVSVPVNGEPTILIAGEEIVFGDDLKVMLPPGEISIVLGMPGFLEPSGRGSGGYTITLPAGVEVRFPEGVRLRRESSRVELPPGAKIVWPKSDREITSSMPAHPVLSRYEPTALFWLRDGGEIALPKGGTIGVIPAPEGTYSLRRPS
jgi:hypothetical protein